MLQNQGVQVTPKPQNLKPKPQPPPSDPRPSMVSTWGAGLGVGERGEGGDGVRDTRAQDGEACTPKTHRVLHPAPLAGYETGYG